MMLTYTITLNTDCINKLQDIRNKLQSLNDPTEVLMYKSKELHTIPQLIKTVVKKCPHNAKLTRFVFDLIESSNGLESITITYETNSLEAGLLGRLIPFINNLHIFITTRLVVSTKPSGENWNVWI